jgi:hypothetical protein
VDVGADDAGAYGVHADGLGAHFLGEADRERIDRAFRGCVIDVFARPAEARGDRGNVDDRAALAAMAPRHALHRLARAEEAARHVDREHALDALGRHLLDAHATVDDAGVVHQRGHAAEPVVHRIEEAYDIGFARHVGLHGNGVPSQLLDKPIGCGAVLFVADCDRVAALSREQRGCRPYAAAPAGDHHDRRHLPRRKSLSRSLIVS